MREEWWFPLEQKAAIAPQCRHQVGVAGVWGGRYIGKWFIRDSEAPTICTMHRWGEKVYDFTAMALSKHDFKGEKEFRR